MENRLKKFFNSRYGMDYLGKFLIILSIIISFLRGLFPEDFAKIIKLISYAVLFYALFRVLSKDVNKRHAENLIYLSKRNKVINIFNEIKDRIKDLNKYRFYKCPNCSQKVRVPKGKGKIKIKCPRCNKEFTKVS